MIPIEFYEFLIGMSIGAVFFTGIFTLSVGLGYSIGRLAKEFHKFLK